MAPLIVLVAFTAIARLVGFTAVAALDSWSVATGIGLAAMFAMTGVAHFVQPKRSGLIAIVPPNLPHAPLVVTVSGVLELLGAVGLLVPQTRALAAICLGLLLIALYPANVYASREKRHPAAPRTPLVRRTIYQGIFIAACVIVVVVK